MVHQPRSQVIVTAHSCMFNLMGGVHPLEDSLEARVVPDVELLRSSVRTHSASDGCTGIEGSVPLVGKAWGPVELTQS